MELCMGKNMMINFKLTGKSKKVNITFKYLQYFGNHHILGAYASGLGLIAPNLLY